MSTGNQNTEASQLIERREVNNRVDQGVIQKDQAEVKSTASVSKPIAQQANPKEPEKPVDLAQGQEANPYAFRDIVAQEVMADASVVMAVAAILTFFVTAVGTFLIWTQVKLTQKAVTDTGKATIAMERQNEMMANAQRPWLDFGIEVTGISKYSVKKPKGSELRIDLKIKNPSNFPALKVKGAGRGGYYGSGLLGSAASGDGEWVRDFLKEEIREDYGDVIFPNQDGMISIFAEILDPHNFSQQSSNSMVTLKVGLKYQFEGGQGLTERTFLLFGVPNFIHAELNELPRSSVLIEPNFAGTEAT